MFQKSWRNHRGRERRAGKILGSVVKYVLFCVVKHRVVEDSTAPILAFAQEMAYKEMHAEKYLLLPGQLVFARMDQAALHPYCGKYQGQRGATGSRVYLDEESKTFFP